MTVGISFTNELEAIVIADSRISGSGRHSDSFNKMVSFKDKKNNYHGEIFGTGSADAAESIFRNPEDFSGETLDDYVASIHQKLKTRSDEFAERHFKNENKKIQNKALLIDDEKQRKEFIENETARALRKYEDFTEQNKTSFIIVAYDVQKNKIRNFGVSIHNYYEIFLQHTEVGSGSDGANMYLSTKLQGIETKKLKTADLIFYATNAYSMATVNEGVGGMPKMVLIRKEGNIPLSLEKTAALTNLSGAHLAEFSKKLDSESTIGYFKDVLSSDKPDYDKIAEVLCLNKEAIIGMAIPYSVWQERANSKRI